MPNLLIAFSLLLRLVASDWTCEDPVEAWRREDDDDGDRRELDKFARSTNLDGWCDGSSGWLNESASMCTWQGICCKSFDDGRGTRVTEIHVESNCLKGRFPGSFVQMSKLKVINVHGNEVTNFPPNVSALVDLREAKFGRNPICGAVPLEFKELRNLTKFNCNFCCLSGQFPDVFADKPFLEEIFWDGNNFTGTIPASVGSLPALTKVSFNLNSLRGGAVPEGLGELPLLHDCRIGSDTDFAPYGADYPWLIQPVAGNLFSCPVPSSIADGVCNSTDADPVPSPVFCESGPSFTTTTTTATTSLHALLRSLTGRKNVFDVVAFGATGDGVTLDTAAIVAAVAAVAAAGEGVLLFPSGGRFLSAPFNLTSHCTLYIAAGASLVGSSNKADYPVIAALPSYGEGKKGGPGRRMSLIHGEDLEDVVVTGANGTIDGGGAAWWYNKTSGDTPPHLVEFMFSSHVEISNVTLINSPFWTVHPYMVEYFLARHLWIINPTNVTNTDGIDPDSTRHALIHDVYIVTGDDGIAIKSGWDEYGYDYGQPSENITIRDCIISTPCAAVAVGSEMSGGVSNVLVSGMRLWDSTAGVHIKSGPGRGGYVRDLVFEDLVMDNCAEGIMIDVDTGGHPPDDATHQLNMSALPDIRDISFRRIRGRNSLTVAKLIGLAPAPLAGITLEDVYFDGGEFKCGNVSGSYRNVVPEPCKAISPM